MNKKCYLLLSLVLLTGCSYIISGESRQKHHYSWQRDPYTGALQQKDAPSSLLTANKGKRRKRTQIHPPIAFVESVKSYRTTLGAFPQDLLLLENFNDRSRKTIREMKMDGFKELTIDYLYLDSLVIAFTFNEDARRTVGNAEFSSIDRNGKFIFVYNRHDSTLMTTTVLPKRKNFVFRN
ncbi:MAG TPA: hypothetical protein VM802_24135 [Chitinophaga sp.]|uniref:hypothetical protein n=1 Tax=Chitinophaga sp. TaxID=1869181 RepID=UPI002B8018EC|nr:hypothetical protein [Chitinophaga sp.]HVI47979.1 hypothetical protein [Chitinophaga sp.]